MWAHKTIPRVKTKEECEGTELGNTTHPPIQLSISNSIYTITLLQQLVFSFLRQSEFVIPLKMALPVVVDAEYLKQIEKARRDLRALIANRNCAPLMLRLA